MPIKVLSNRAKNPIIGLGLGAITGGTIGAIQAANDGNRKTSARDGFLKGALVGGTVGGVGTMGRNVLKYRKDHKQFLRPAAKEFKALKKKSPEAMDFIVKNGHQATVLNDLARQRMVSAKANMKTFEKVAEQGHALWGW